MGFTGSLKGLGQLERNLGKLAGVPAQIAGDASDSIAELIDEEFEAGNDPYGRPWAALAQATLDKGRGPPPLTDTEAMRESVVVAPMQGAGISITIDHPGGVHQTGARKGAWSMPARPVLPDATFPATWKKALDTAAQARLDATLGDDK